MLFVICYNFNIHYRSSNQTAKNLVALMKGADLREQSSVDEVVCEMMRQKLFNQEVIKHLWAYLDQRTEQPEGRAALQLLGMIARYCVLNKCIFVVIIELNDR